MKKYQSNANRLSGVWLIYASEANENSLWPIGRTRPLEYGGYADLKELYELSEKGLHEPETTYPLSLVFCEKCALLQLDYVVDPKLVDPQNWNEYWEKKSKPGALNFASGGNPLEPLRRSSWQNCIHFP